MPKYKAPKHLRTKALEHSNNHKHKPRGTRAQIQGKYQANTKQILNIPGITSPLTSPGMATYQQRTYHNGQQSLKSMPLFSLLDLNHKTNKYNVCE